ncbi:MAG: ATP-binding cassette domain-containing protein [Thermoplasmata archaeon]
MPALMMRDVDFTYEGSSNKALEGVNVSIGRGEFVTILGANGAGKTTLAMLTNGLIPQYVKGAFSGRVEVFGNDISKFKVAQISTIVGMVFQEPESQLFCMNVEEEVAFGPENLGVPRREIEERVNWALDLVGMTGYNERSPSSLSGGQKQRVAIAAALSMKPHMIVLDEPAYALDPVGRIELYQVLDELKREQNMTILLMERDAEDVAAFSDRIVLMRGGRVVRTGAPEEVLLNASELSEAGVSPPQMAQVALCLNKRIGQEEFAFLTVDDAEEAIVRTILSRKRGEVG